MTVWQHMPAHFISVQVEVNFLFIHSPIFASCSQPVYSQCIRDTRAKKFLWRTHKKRIPNFNKQLAVYTWECTVCSAPQSSSSPALAASLSVCLMCWQVTTHHILSHTHCQTRKGAMISDNHITIRQTAWCCRLQSISRRWLNSGIDAWVNLFGTLRLEQDRIARKAVWFNLKQTAAMI